MAQGFIRNIDGTFILFDAPGAADQSTYAYSINNNGDVAGNFNDGTSWNNGFIRHADGTFETYSIPDIGLGSLGSTCINNSGVISGYYLDGDDVSHGFLRATDGTITTVDAPGSEQIFGHGTSVNRRSLDDDGNMAGIFTNEVAPGIHYFVRHPDGSFDIFDTGSNYGQLSINTHANTAIGWYFDAALYQHGYLNTPITQLVSGGTYDPTNPNVPEIGFLRDGSGNITYYQAPDAYLGVDGGTVPTDLNGLTLPPPISLRCASGEGALDEAYSSYLIASGGTTPYFFSIIDGILPPGLSLNSSTGLISGIPSRPGNYPYTAQVVDSASPPNVATASCRIFISDFTCFLVDFPINGPFYDATGKVLSNGYLALRLVFDCNCPCADYQITGNNHTTIQLDSNGMVTGSPQIRPNDQLKPNGSYYILQAFSEAGQLVLGPKVLLVTS